ncbi:fibronectin type III domain-containing protein [uncultured Tenacibaculum sp.]|uniref:fibronectin type III domain-containing protein n=1 Tax=uncultured Tenacibaculum sp. TaxID=174713 RepID=UPI00261B2553|nr:fibronectin type III domain-containing protein [uncultured Tenacibaculum sp.]
MKLFKVLLLLFPFAIMGQEIITETINVSDRQGVTKECGFSYCNFFEKSGERIEFNNQLNINTNARYLFEHPNFLNKQIKKITLNIVITNSTTAYSNNNSRIVIREAKLTCNETIPWTFPSPEKLEELYLCNNSGERIVDYYIEAPHATTVSEEVIIYDANATGFSNSTLQYFDPNSNFLTLTFSPNRGRVDIKSAKLNIVYEDLSVPKTPTLNGYASSKTKVNLNWDSIFNATSYEVYNCNTNQKITTVTSNSYVVNNLNPDTTYKFKVRALNNNGFSNFSNCKSVTTKEDIVKPITPTLTGFSDSTSSIVLNWNQISNATSYQLYDCNNQLITTVNSNSYTHTGLSAGTTYTYKIRAKNSAGNSNFSSCLSVDVLGCIENITIANEIISSDYDAADTVVISNSESEPNTVAYIKAGSSLRLLPKTHLKRNSVVNLKVQECLVSARIILQKKEINSRLNKDDNIHQIESNEFNIYPNPFSDRLTLKTEKKIKVWHIYNVLNQRILIGNSAIINTSSLSNGYYIINVLLDSGELIKKKIIKNK